MDVANVVDVAGVDAVGVGVVDVVVVLMVVLDHCVGHDCYD